MGTRQRIGVGDMRPRDFFIGMAAGALVVGSAWVERSHQGGSSAEASSGPARVSACMPNYSLSMTIEATNRTTSPVQYDMEAYWFAADGSPYLVKSAQTEAIAPGGTATVTAGNPADHQDYKAGVTCQIKVLSAS